MSITLESLCGKHIFSGCELTTETIKGYFGEEQCNICLFLLDGITYIAIENPDDGYRSYCEDLKISEKTPRYTFPGIEVLCSMMENEDCQNNNVLVIRDVANGKTILEVGTKNYDDWYPYCHFSYTPENMVCNQEEQK